MLTLLPAIHYIINCCTCITFWLIFYIFNHANPMLKFDNPLMKKDLVKLQVSLYSQDIPNFLKIINFTLAFSHVCNITFIWLVTFIDRYWSWSFIIHFGATHIFLWFVYYFAASGNAIASDVTWMPVSINAVIPSIMSFKTQALPLPHQPHGITSFHMTDHKPWIS